jgi:hypothetical protein
MVGAADPRRHRHRLDGDRRLGRLAIRPGDQERVTILQTRRNGT